MSLLSQCSTIHWDFLKHTLYSIYLSFAHQYIAQWLAFSTRMINICGEKQLPCSCYFSITLLCALVKCPQWLFCSAELHPHCTDLLSPPLHWDCPWIVRQHSLCWLRWSRLFLSLIWHLHSFRYTWLLLLQRLLSSAGFWVHHTWVFLLLCSCFSVGSFDESSFFS